MTQTLGSDWRSAKDSNRKGLTASTLHRIRWHRIILDVSPASPDPMILCLNMVLMMSLPGIESAEQGSSMRGRL